MKTSVMLALVLGLGACSNQTVLESQRSKGLSPHEESDNDVYQVPIEAGTFVTAAIRTDDLAVISQEVVETFSSMLPSTSASPAAPANPPKDELASNPVTASQSPESAKAAEISKSPEPPQYPEPPKVPSTPAKPALPPEIQTSLAACYPQWEKLPWANETMIDIRTFTLDVQKLKKTNLQLAGSNPELVFVKIDSATRVAKVSLSMMNKKALYCVDIDAGKVINKLELVTVCGAKVGTVSIDAGRVAKNISFREVCP